MRKFQHQSWLRRLAVSRPVQVLFLLLIILMGVRVFGLYQNKQNVRAEEISREKELAKLIARRDKLMAEVASLTTDRGVEEAIRERLGVVKPGEKVINLVGDTPTPPPVPPSIPWWQKIMEWFK
ncbi:MAG: septum formation initiator family protein [Candidatus Vogelbacteria bacterium]